MKKWIHKTLRGGSLVKVSDVDATAPRKTEKPAQIAQSNWVLETGRTVVFYNGHPEFDIVAGAKGKIVAQRSGGYRNYCDLYLDRVLARTPKDLGRNLLVEVGGTLLEVTRGLVRIKDAPKKRCKVKA